MSAGHTPGPWVVTHTNGSYWVESQDTVICLVQGANLTPAQNSEHAKLIAAARELLAALRDCVAVMQIDLKGLAVIQPELRAALAAIAKATGETP